MKTIQKICFCFAVIILLSTNAQAGRWLTRDPIEFMERDPQVNLYKYVDNNPINEVDPLGLQSWMGPGYGSLPTPQNIVPSNMQYQPDPNIDKAKQWLKKCHPEIAPGSIIESDFLNSIDWEGWGVPWSHPIGGIVFIAPGLGLDEDVNILAHEGMHTVQGPAFGPAHDAIFNRARDIEREFWADPDGKKCDKCKK